MTIVSPRRRYNFLKCVFAYLNKIIPTGVVIFLKTLELNEKMSLRGKAAEMPSALKTILLHTVLFFAGLVTGGIDELSAVSPFGVAFAVAVPQKFILSGGLGAAAGYILTQDSVSALRYIAALVSACVLSRLMCEFEKIKSFKLLPSCIGFLACFLSSIAVVLAKGIEISSFLLCLGEGILCFISAYFFSAAVSCVQKSKPSDGLSVRELLPIAGAVFILLLSVCDISVFKVSFSRIAACLAIIVCSYAYNEAGGAVAGILATFIFSISPDVGVCAVCFAVGGLLAGAFSYSKKIMPAVAFIISFLTAYMFSGGASDKLYILIEAAVATVIFVSLPEKAGVKIKNILLPQNDAPDCNAQREAVLLRLKSAAQAVDDIERSVNAVSRSIINKEDKNRDEILLGVQTAVCKGCGRYFFCWEQNFADTMKSIGEMREMLKESKPLNANNAPSMFSNRCIRLTSFTENYNKGYAAFVASASAQKKIEEIRSVTADQFGGICDMLYDLSNEFSKDIKFDTALASKIKSAVENEFDKETGTVSCYRNSDGRIRAEISFLKRPNELNLGELRDSVSEICGREFDLPVIKSDDTVYFCEKTRFVVETASAQLPADDEKLCGDNFESFYDGRGNYIVILSDGMGTGPRAAVDSAMAAGLMSRLVKAGFSFESSLRLVNSSLLLKSKDESLATLDILKIDLYSGKAVFYKAGAAASVIKRRNKILEIKKAALPAGILRDASFASCEGEVQPGDIIVLASDGAFDYSKNSVRDELLKTKDEDAVTVAGRIGARAKNTKGKNRCDDITVITLKIKCRQQNR